MPTWSYDSYCNDNVMEYINDNFLIAENVIEDMMDNLKDYPSEFDLEFIIGVSMYCIRNNLDFCKDFLRTIRDVMDWLVEEGKFKNWINKEKRIKKVKYERKIIANLIAGKKLKFGKLIEKPSEFKNLNDDY